MDYYVHTPSRFMVNKLLDHDVSHLVTDHNEGGRQSINIENKHNQKLVLIQSNRVKR